MEPRDQDVLFRYQKRLTELLEPAELLSYLMASGLLNRADEEILLQNGDFPRETRVAVLLDCLRTYEDGFHYFVKGLLLNKKQGFIGRELLDDDVYGESDVKLLLQELKDDLDEVQFLKLELLQERKKHDSTKRELEEVKSSRNSAVFSECSSSGCSGFESSDTDAVSYLIRELEQERKRREEAEYTKRCHEQELEHLAQKTEILEQSNQELLRAVRSLEDVSKAQDDEAYFWESRLPWKASSLADLCHSDEYNDDNQERITKWKSEGDGLMVSRKTFNISVSPVSDKSNSFMELVQKVNCLEEELQEERARRESSEFEIMKLGFENEELLIELEETQEQLQGSQLDLSTTDDNYENYEPENEMEQMECIPAHPTDNSYVGSISTQDNNSFHLFSDDRIQANTFASSTLIREFPNPQHSRVESSNVPKGWRNLNIEHYEMDEYDREIERAPDDVALDFRDVVRRLKSETWMLMHQAMEEGKKLRSLRLQAEKLKSRTIEDENC